MCIIICLGKGEMYHYKNNFLFVPCKKSDFRKKQTLVQSLLPFKNIFKIIEKYMDSKNEVRAPHLYESKLLVLEFIFDHFRRQISIIIILT